MKLFPFKFCLTIYKHVHRTCREKNCFIWVMFVILFVCFRILLDYTSLKLAVHFYSYSFKYYNGHFENKFFLNKKIQFTFFTLVFFSNLGENTIHRHKLHNSSTMGKRTWETYISKCVCIQLQSSEIC